MWDRQRIINRMVANRNRLSETCKILWDKRTRSFHFIYTVVQSKSEDTKSNPTFDNKRVASNDPGCNPLYSPTSNHYGVLLDGV
jgi:hypothetical protein